MHKRFYQRPRNYGCHYQAIILLSISLKDALNQKIKGSVWIEPKNDKLSVTIHSPTGVVYSYTVYNVYDKIVKGCTSQTIAVEIYNSYKGFIKNLYFY